MGFHRNKMKNTLFIQKDEGSSLKRKKKRLQGDLQNKKFKKKCMEAHFWWSKSEMKTAFVVVFCPNEVDKSKYSLLSALFFILLISLTLNLIIDPLDQTYSQIFVFSPHHLDFFSHHF